MRSPERLSIRARVLVSILALVVTIVTALSVLHLYGVVWETFEDAGERALIVAEHTKTYVLEHVNRQAAASAPRDSFEENKQIWYKIIREDPVLPRILQKTLAQSKQVIEVSVVDDREMVLAASDPRIVGTLHRPSRAYSEWQQQSSLIQLRQLFDAHEDYLVSVPLGVPGSEQPAITVRVFISSVLLRALVLPKLRELLTISALSLLLSVLLAILVANLVGRSLKRIGKDIDRITEGDLGADEEQFESPELANLQSKLNWLGNQFRGAREDVIHLRSNIDQLLRSLEDAVLVFGPNGRLQMAGSPALRLLARSNQDLIGHTVDDIFPRWTPIGSVVHRAAYGREGIRDEPVNLDRPNMPTAHLLLNMEPINYGEGRIGTLITLRDAESRRKLRSQLDTANRLSAISRLAAGVAHEIKNPLNAIMLHLEIAHEKGERGESAEAELGVIKGELLRLDRVVKTFLDFNRPLEMHMTDCDLVELMREITALIQPEAQHRSVMVEFESGMQQASISGDRDLLKQCILNVVVNGLEATQAGGHLRLWIDKAADECVLNIQDDGEGIPPEIQDKIFNLYFTTKPAGTGIGLSIAYRVVQLHCGTITFESEPGRGTSFRLRFPIAKPEEVAA